MAARISHTVYRLFIPAAYRDGARLAHHGAHQRGSTDVPTLFRFLATLAILAGLVFAGMFALATFVEPTPREMSVTIPASKLQPGGK